MYLLTSIFCFSVFFFPLWLAPFHEKKKVDYKLASVIASVTFLLESGRVICHDVNKTIVIYTISGSWWGFQNFKKLG